MHAPLDDRISRTELRAGASLAAIFALRMLGLFLILPVFSLHAKSIPGGDNLTLVGLALGAYGLTQAMFQIPFGRASDRFGRKRVIVIGLLLFAAGSFIAAFAGDIYTTIFGRAIQGAGAISAAVTALAADLTREQHRTKIMAMIGSSIGLVFALSLVAAPALYGAIGMGGLFATTGVLALAAIGLLRFAVPQPPPLPQAAPVPFREVLFDGQLLRLNAGIFTLHLAQMAMFVVMPGLLVATGGVPLKDHWQIYLPVVLGSFVLMVPAIIVAEKKRRMREVFLAAIGLLLATEIGFALAVGHSFAALVGLLLSFFVAFNVLEASLPSMISRVAPPRAKGAALGVYNTTQAFGLFLGGAVGGALAESGGAGVVFVFCAVLVALWLLLASGMKRLPEIVRRECILPSNADLATIGARLSALPGVREAIVVAEARVAYLRINLEGWDESRLRRVLEGES